MTLSDVSAVLSLSLAGLLILTGLPLCAVLVALTERRPK